MRIQWLFQRFQEQASQTAILYREHPYSYGWFCERVRAWEDVLRDNAVPEGSVIAIVGDYTPQACALFLALLNRGDVVVPLAAVTEQNRRNFMEIAEVTHTFHVEDSGDYELEVQERTSVHPFYQTLRQNGDPGLVLFSSGSTGTPKGMVHNMSVFLEKYQTFRKASVTLAFLLFDHIGGINTLLHVLSNGGTLVVPMDRKPETICRLIEAHRVEVLPTTPSFLNLLLLSRELDQTDLSSLQTITYGTEVMQESVLKRLQAKVPQVKLSQTYGLSEVGILRARSEADGSLWVRVGGEGIEVKVVEGELWIHSKFRMLGYLNAPNPFDEDGWFNTGDRVEQKGEYFHILGRASELINVGGQKVYPVEVESVLMELPNVQDVVVYKEKNALLGETVAVRVQLLEPEEPAAFRTRLKTFCKNRLEPYKIPVKITIADDAQHNERFKKIRRSVELIGGRL